MTESIEQLAKAFVQDWTKEGSHYLNLEAYFVKAIAQAREADKQTIEELEKEIQGYTVTSMGQKSKN